VPELPEVETVRASLTPLIQGKTIRDVGTNWGKILTNGLDQFQEQVAGQRVERLDRRGKYLLIRLSGGLTIVSHLRMEGKYELVQHADDPMHKFVHVWLTFTDGSQLRYRDSRKFGRMTLVKTGEEMHLSGLRTIGPEPTEATFDVDAFYQTLQRHKKAIKSVILDQSTVAGVGNIYADECLWLAKIHPETPANHLTKRDAKRLRDTIIEELALATKARGTSAHTYLDATGHKGDFQNQLHVYDRKGQPCDRCATPIEKIKVNQRGTNFCPHCQKIK